MADTKFLVVCCKEVKVLDEWYIRNTNKVVEAKDKTEAEWKVRDMGYTPLYSKKFDNRL